MRRKRPYRPAPLILPVPTLAAGAGQLAHLAQLWAEFTGRMRVTGGDDR